MTKKSLPLLIALALASPMALQAQDNEEPKEEETTTAARPSWSSGMPERQNNSTDLTKPDFSKLEDNLEIEIDRSDFGFKPEPIQIAEPVQIAAPEPEPEPEPVQITAPEPEPEPVQITAPEPEPEPVQIAAPEPEPEPVQIAEPEPEPVQIAAPEPEQVRIVEPIQIAAPEPVQITEPTQTAEAPTYNWKIIENAPLNYPPAAARKGLTGWVDVLVTINSNGDVIDAKAEKNSVRGRVFVSAAVESLKKYKFDPPANQGITDNVSRTYQIEFKL